MSQFDVETVLGGLKDFQRRTVDYVFQRMYLDEPAAQRFLVADEVGLGKTLVARGVIARALEHMYDRVDRVDVVYVCSNAAIAQQNVNRLNVLGDRHVAMATRLTLLPTQVHDLRDHRVNFVSFTPGTTFELRSSGGVVQERVVLYRALRRAWPDLSTPLLNLLQCTAGKDNWRWWARKWNVEIDRPLTDAFRAAVENDPALVTKLAAVSSAFARHKQTYGSEVSRARYLLIGELRRLLATVCVNALEPDLVILDEFQRFRTLLHGETEAAELARTLMSYQAREGYDVRVLLLSATPYRMLTLDHEADEEHYADFLKTFEFLTQDPVSVGRLKQSLSRFRQSMYSQHGDSESELTEARDSVQEQLLSAMVRTERVAATEGLDAMTSVPTVESPLDVADLSQARLIDSVSREVGARDALEYWKSAPYLLNFMRGYDVKKRFEEASSSGSEALLETLSTHKRSLLKRRTISQYREVDPANARLRSLLNETVEPGNWRMLWIPPALPYFSPAGPYAEQPTATKALLFSAWNVVPDTIAALTSYEAERRMLAGSDDVPAYEELAKKRKALLRFVIDPDGRASGMTALALMYPCVSLAEVVDPLWLALHNGGGSSISEDTCGWWVRKQISTKLRSLGNWPPPTTGQVDRRWYWAALALLDSRHAPEVGDWIRRAHGWAASQTDEDGDVGRGLRGHIDEFYAVFRNSEGLGRPPEDFWKVLTELAFASPAICALRALKRVAPDRSMRDPELMQAAARIAGGFRTLFNLPDSMALLRAGDEQVYWRTVLRHGIDGNLQSMLDEYIHILRESLGFVGHDEPGLLSGIAEAICEALSIRASRVEFDEVHVRRGRGTYSLQRQRLLRSRFALRFSEIKDDRGTTLSRIGAVRQAFNSPFKPFILATTSVGQEGLDFHPYCHVVYHWNLPSNPVDMEQREGRVHRYKGHAVRKNVAQRYGLAGVQQGLQDGGDPWSALFRRAEQDRRPDQSDLTPYWIYPLEGGATIERRVPLLPYSREEAHLERLRQSLAIYRMVFGQPRQEDLLAYLNARIQAGEHVADVSKWRISLEPPRGAVD